MWPSSLRGWAPVVNLVPCFLKYCVIIYKHLNNQFYIDVYDVLDKRNYMDIMNFFFNTRVVI